MPEQKFRGLIPVCREFSETLQAVVGELPDTREKTRLLTIFERLEGEIGQVARGIKNLTDAVGPIPDQDGLPQTSFLKICGPDDDGPGYRR